MSTVKISQLANLPSIAANTSNTLFLGVDIPSGITGKFTATTLAQQLFANNILNVGINQENLPNTIAQFSLGGNAYIQTNLVNTNDGGSADMVITANVGSGGSDTTNFIDMGWANKNFVPGSEYNSLGTAINPNDGYIYTQGTPGQPNGNLVIGTVSTGTELRFIAGGGSSSNVVAKFTSNSFVLSSNVILTTPKGSGSNLIIDPDGSADVVFPPATELIIQSGAASTSNTTGALQILGGVGMTGSLYTGGHYITGAGNGITFVDGTTLTTAPATIAYTQAAFAKANAALANASGTFAGDLTITGNVYSLNSIAAANVQAQYLVGNVIGSSIANTIQWQLNTIAPTQSAGQLWYSANDYALVVDTDIPGDRPLQGKSLIERVYNGSGTVIPSNTWVRLAGSVTQNAIPYVVLADATNSANAVVSGFIKNAIQPGAYGYSYLQGVVSNINNLNSLGYNNGDLLFLSTTPGYATNTAPTGSNVVVQLGKVLNAATSNGKIQVSIMQSPQYGKASGAVLYANNNVIVASNTIVINDSAQTLTMNGTIFIASSNFPQTSAALRIDGSNNSVAQNTTSTGTMLQIIGKDAGYATRVLLDNYSYGSPTAYPLFAGRAARGNSSNPSPVQTNDILMRIGSQGYGNTYTLLGGAAITSIALENYTDATKGSQINLETTPVGTNTRFTTVSVNTSVVTVNTNLTVANTIQYNAAVNNNTVTQLTSKSTTVTSNGRTGQITTNGANINKGAAVTFTVNNSYIVSAKDVVIVNIASGASVGYALTVTNVTPGSFNVTVNNCDGTPSGSNAADTLVINYAIIRVA